MNTIFSYFTLHQFCQKIIHFKNLIFSILDKETSVAIMLTNHDDQTSDQNPVNEQIATEKI